VPLVTRSPEDAGFSNQVCLGSDAGPEMSVGGSGSTDAGTGSDASNGGASGADNAGAGG
jgi:hypothetical protein